MDKKSFVFGITPFFLSCGGVKEKTFGVFRPRLKERTRMAWKTVSLLTSIGEHNVVEVYGSLNIFVSFSGFIG